MLKMSTSAGDVTSKSVLQPRHNVEHVKPTVRSLIQQKKEQQPLQNVKSTPDNLFQTGRYYILPKTLPGTPLNHTVTEVANSSRLSVQTYKCEDFGNNRKLLVPLSMVTRPGTSMLSAIPASGVTNQETKNSKAAKGNISSLLYSAKEKQGSGNLTILGADRNNVDDTRKSEKTDTIVSKNVQEKHPCLEVELKKNRSGIGSNESAYPLSCFAPNTMSLSANCPTMGTMTKLPSVDLVQDSNQEQTLKISSVCSLACNKQSIREQKYESFSDIDPEMPRLSPIRDLPLCDSEISDTGDRNVSSPVDTFNTVIKQEPVDYYDYDSSYLVREDVPSPTLFKSEPFSADIIKDIQIKQEKFAENSDPMSLQFLDDASYQDLSALKHISHNTRQHVGRGYKANTGCSKTGYGSKTIGKNRKQDQSYEHCTVKLRRRLNANLFKETVRGQLVQMLFDAEANHVMSLRMQRLCYVESPLKLWKSKQKTDNSSIKANCKIKRSPGNFPKLKIKFRPRPSSPRSYVLIKPKLSSETSSAGDTMNTSDDELHSSSITSTTTVTTVTMTNCSSGSAEQLNQVQISSTSANDIVTASPIYKTAVSMTNSPIECKQKQTLGCTNNSATSRVAISTSNTTKTAANPTACFVETTENRSKGDSLQKKQERVTTVAITNKKSLPLTEQKFIPVPISATVSSCPTSSTQTCQTKMPTGTSVSHASQTSHAPIIVYPGRLQNTGGGATFPSVTKPQQGIFYIKNSNPTCIIPGYSLVNLPALASKKKLDPVVTTAYCNLSSITQNSSSTSKMSSIVTQSSPSLVSNTGTQFIPPVSTVSLVPCPATMVTTPGINNTLPSCSVIRNTAPIVLRFVKPTTPFVSLAATCTLSSAALTTTTQVCTTVPHVAAMTNPTVQAIPSNAVNKGRVIRISPSSTDTHFNYVIVPASSSTNIQQQSAESMSNSSVEFSKMIKHMGTLAKSSNAPGKTAETKKFIPLTGNQSCLVSMPVNSATQVSSSFQTLEKPAEDTRVVFKLANSAPSAAVPPMIPTTAKAVQNTVAPGAVSKLTIEKSNVKKTVVTLVPVPTASGQLPVRVLLPSTDNMNSNGIIGNRTDTVAKIPKLSEDLHKERIRQLKSKLCESEAAIEEWRRKKRERLCTEDSV